MGGGESILMMRMKILEWAILPASLTWICPAKVSTAANTGEQAQNRANSDEEVSPDEDQTEDSDFDVIADIGNMGMDDSQGDDNGSDEE